MPGTRCAVALCSNSRIKTVQEGKDIAYHRFPKNEELLLIWIERCGRNGDWNPYSSRVCSDHFTESDYENDIQSEIMQLPKRRNLKPTGNLFL